jgi:transcriptional regulator with XRE-family HTH domain
MQDLPEEYLPSFQSRAQAIGERLRERRRALALTQEQLRAQLELELVYISRTQYSRIEQVRSAPDGVQLIGLQRVLGISFDWMLLGEPTD